VLPAQPSAQPIPHVAEVLQLFRLSVKTPVAAILLKTQPLNLRYLGTGGFCGTGVFTLESNLCNTSLWGGVYLRGLLLEGERKSIEPLSRRVSLPAQLAAVADPEQALQQFVNQSSWDEAAVAREYRAALAETLADPDGVFVVDDTTFPKAGRHSVGVQRQHCGALGKKANCQCAVSLHYVAPQGHGPLSMRLYLPSAWLHESVRLDRAGVPPEERRDLTKGQIALELLDQARAEGWPGQVVVADSGYGSRGRFAGNWRPGACSTWWASRNK
jgi:SRSO17 transposase